MQLRYEAGSGSTAFEHEGNKVGLTFRFTQALRDDWYWGGDARQSHGNINYSSASRGEKGGNADVLTEVRITGGKDYPLGSQLLAPYFGLGFRKLSTDLKGLTSTGDEGYRRRSQYVYLPLGLTHRAQLVPRPGFRPASNTTCCLTAASSPSCPTPTRPPTIRSTASATAMACA